MRITAEDYRLGKVAYDAYCKQTGGKSLISGENLPTFPNLRAPIQEAWAVAAHAVAVDSGSED